MQNLREVLVNELKAQGFGSRRITHRTNPVWDRVLEYQRSLGQLIPATS